MMQERKDQLVGAIAILDNVAKGIAPDKDRVAVNDIYNKIIGAAINFVWYEPHEADGQVLAGQPAMEAMLKLAEETVATGLKCDSQNLCDLRRVFTFKGFL